MHPCTNTTTSVKDPPPQTMVSHLIEIRLPWQLLHGSIGLLSACFSGRIQQGHIHISKCKTNVFPSILWDCFGWDEIYQLWIYWTELIYKSSPQHLMGGWVRLTCKTICFYWSSSCGLTLTQWKPAITWAFLSMFPIQKVEMRFKNLLARKPILESSYSSTPEVRFVPPSLSEGE